MAGPRRDDAPFFDLILLALSLATLAGCSFNASGLGQTGEGSQTSTGGSDTGGPTTGGEPPTTTEVSTTGTASQHSASGESGTSGSSGPVDPETGTSTTGEVTTATTASTTDVPPMTTTGGDASTSTGGDDSTSTTGCMEEHTFFKDGDMDSFGSAADTVTACTAPPGYVDNDDDCNDGDGAVKPGADEVCDGKDNDCDDLVDEFAPPTNVDCNDCNMALYNNEVYYFCDKAKLWDDARKACIALGAALVKDDDMAEHDWIANQIPDNTGAWFIGGRSPNNDDNFVWLDNSPVPAPPDVRWGFGRPQIGLTTSVLVIVSDINDGYWGTFNRKWYDREDYKDEPYVCEGPLPP